jgi:hypothetical protein
MKEPTASPPQSWQSLEPEERETRYAQWRLLSADVQDTLAVWIAEGWQPSVEDLADLLKLDRGEESPDAQIERVRRALRARLG